jgi:hypothetical protein
MPDSYAGPLEAGPEPSRQLVSQFKVSELTACRRFLRRGRLSGQPIYLHAWCHIASKKPRQIADNLTAGVVQRKRVDRHSPDRCESFDEKPAKHEVLGPLVPARMEERHEVSARRVDAGEVWSLGDFRHP